MKRLMLILGCALVLCSSLAFADDYPLVRMETSLGDMTIELYPDKAPNTVDNFLEYVKSGFYDGTVFHRVVPGFVIQGGGLNENLDELDTNLPIMCEADNGLRNQAYTLSMARTSSPHSATSQFFINLDDNRALDHRSRTREGWGYAVFGRVVEGQNVADAIGRVRTVRIYPHDNVPVPAVVITKVYQIR